MIRVRGLRCAYGARPVLHDVDLDVAPGRVLGLIGPNGSGKTTLLRCLYGAIAPQAGTVELGGQDLSRLAPRERARRVAVVAQDDSGELPMTVAEVALLGRIPHRGPLQRRREEDLDLAARALEQVGALHLAQRPVAELSGGERQRVLIARAVVQQGQVLLMDEPTNHLDIGSQHAVLRIVRGLGLTTVLVLHDLNLAARYCDEVALLVGGRVRAHGAPAEVLRPGLVGGVYGMDAELRRAEDGVPQLLFRGLTEGTGPGTTVPGPDRGVARSGTMGA